MDCFLRFSFPFSLFIIVVGCIHFTSSFPPLALHSSTFGFLGMAAHAWDGWMDGLWKRRLTCCLVRGVQLLLPGRFSDGMEFRRKGVGLYLL